MSDVADKRESTKLLHNSRLYFGVVAGATIIALLSFSWKSAGPQLSGQAVGKEEMAPLWGDQYVPIDRPPDEIGPPWPVGFSRQQSAWLDNANRILVAQLHDTYGRSVPLPPTESTIRFHGITVERVREFEKPEDITSITTMILDGTIAEANRWPEQGGPFEYGVRIETFDTMNGESRVVDLMMEFARESGPGCMFIYTENEKRHCNVNSSLRMNLAKAFGRPGE